MTYLFSQMLLYLLAFLLLGLLLGWIVWGWRQPAAATVSRESRAEGGDLARLRNDLAGRDQALSELRAELASARAAAESTSGSAPVAAGLASGVVDPTELRAAEAAAETLRQRVADLEHALAGAQADRASAEAAAGADDDGAAARAEIDRLQDDLADLRLRAAESERAAAEVPALRADLKAALEARDTAQAELAARGSTALEPAADATAAALSAQPAADAELSALQARIDRLEDDLADAKRAAEEATAAEAARAQATAAAEELRAELERCAAARATLLDDLGRVRGRAVAAEQALRDLRAAEPPVAPASFLAAPAPAAVEAPVVPEAPIEAHEAQAFAAEAGTAPADGEPVAPGAAALDPDAVGDRPVLLEAPRESGPDDLKRIKGVGPKLEQVLHDLGVYHFEQIAAWSDREAAWIDARLRFPGRIARDGWIEQARKLAAGEETEFSKKVDRGGVYD